jgi:hypothetical protein
MEKIRSFETSVEFYRTSGHHISEDSGVTIIHSFHSVCVTQFQGTSSVPPKKKTQCYQFTSLIFTTIHVSILQKPSSGG